MEAQAKPRDLGSRERNELRDHLRACNALRLAEAYEAAVALLGQPDFPARRHLLAHLVREIANGLPEVVTGDKILRFETTEALDDLAPAWLSEVPESAPFAAVADATPAPTVTISPRLAAQVSGLVRDHKRVASNRRDKTASMLEALRPGSLALRPALEPVIRQWLANVDRFTATAHVSRGERGRSRPKPRGRKARHSIQTEQELVLLFKSFEGGLRGILAGHFQVTHEIDEILATAPPGAETLTRLMPLLGGAQQLHHFFERLDDPAWLEPLVNSGLLSKVPGAVVHESAAGRSIRYPGWPAATFLLRVAGHEAAQERIVEVADKLPDVDNPWVHRDVAEIALRLQPRFAARLVRQLVEWLATSSYVDWSQFDEKLGALAARLAEGGERASALRLLRTLVGKPVRNHRGERVTLEPYSLRRTLRRHLPAIIGGLGLEGLTAVCKALDAELRSWGEDPEQDRSAMWRPALELEGQFSGSARDVLVEAVVRAGELCVANGAATLPEVVERLEAGRAWIFRRIALYLLASTPDAPADCLTARLLDRGLFDAFDRAREYRRLLQRGFTRLATEAQQQLLTWIDAGPYRMELRGLLERWAASVPTDDDVARAYRRWQWRRLAVLQADLAPEWRERYSALEQEFGIVDADAAVDLPVWPARDETPSARMLPDDVVRAMPTTEIAAHLRIPWAERSRQPAFVSEFQFEQRVTAEPQRDTDRTLAFKGCPPEVLDHLFGGLRFAVHQRRSFGWSNVLHLASWALGQAGVHECPVPHATQDGADADVSTRAGWSRTRSAIIGLLEVTLRTQDSSLGLDDSEGLWRLLNALTRSREAETRVKAIDLIAFYRAWLDAAARRAGTPITSEPDVTAALSAMLDATPTREVHEAFGRHMEIWTLCERAWLEQHVDRIFSTTDDGLFEAAWSAYLDEHKDYAGALAARFGILRPVYVRAVETMTLPGITGNELIGGTEPARAEAQVVARDLLALYGAGVIDLDDPLLRRLFERADGRLRLQALFAAGHNLLRWASADGLARFRALWCWRRETIEHNPSRSDELAQELPAFGSWFMWGDFGEEWKLDQLDFVLRRAQPVDGDTDWWEPVRLIIEVLRRLAAMAARLPRRAVNCLALLSERLTTSAQLRPDEVTTILATALRSGDATAQAQAIETFHRLGSLGFRAHELLPFSDDLDDPATIAYFTWDHPMTVAEIRARLTQASASERDRMLGQILREARDTDVWKFTTPQEVVERWPQIERHLGKRRAFWTSLLDAWKAQGLLAG